MQVRMQLVGALWLSLGLIQVGIAGTDGEIRFGRDVLPILSANCFACHGPDAAERKANLRLDLEADVTVGHDSGIPIVPGKPIDSTLMQRITSADPDQIMPPKDSHKTLTAEQIEILTKWIADGAVWGRHWSFEPVQRPAVVVESGTSVIDALVADRLGLKGLSLRTAASPWKLARRVSLDLTGLPPTMEQAEKFAIDPSEAAWEHLVDELLASPRFGEHWARLWMDLGRYADTKGYEKDLGRTMWPWRDWLVTAINADMPLDQMTVELLAGDLLPNPTHQQLIATAFHRNTMSNDEGGTDDEEFRSIAVKDRVDTTIQVWMGLTAGCAKCHSHKYDPISLEEYYGLYAIFNQTQDADRYDDAPTLEIPDERLNQRRQTLEGQISELRQELAEAESVAAPDESRWTYPIVSEIVSSGGAKFKVEGDHSIVVSGDRPKEDTYAVTMTLAAGRHTVLRLEALQEKFPDGQFGVGRNPRDPNFVLSELTAEIQHGSRFQPMPLHSPRADFSQDGWPVTAAVDGDLKTGWAISPRQREKHTALFILGEPLQLETAAVLRLRIVQNYGDSLTLRRFRIATIDEDASRIQIPEASADERRLREELAVASKSLQDLNAEMPRLPILKALDADKARMNRIHRRGNFLDPGDEVRPGLPAAFQTAPEGSELNRMALAKWLVSPENPLTPRVWSNRIWARLFGTGLVETEEDFGALGSLPTHPELLDWMAAEYRDRGWSLKQLLKSIVLSRTYQQDSAVSEELHRVDPRNLWLSRGARFRLSAEVVRDQALAVSGLLSGKMGGPPVMPPQPDGLWRSTYSGKKWINAEGEDRFRRALYTYLKRTSPYPSMTTFDGGSGEICQIRRIRTNTPLQALVTMNDPVYFEAAGALAGRMMTASATAPERVAFGLRCALVRPAESLESDSLLRLQADVLAAFQNETDEAGAVIRSARGQCPAGMSEPEFASWIVVASTILNLDEFLTHL